MSLACDTCPVRERAACSVLGDSDRSELAKSGRMRQLARGETLFLAGKARPPVPRWFAGR